MDLRLLEGPFARGEKLGVAVFGRPDFEIVGGLVIILRQQSERHFQIVLPRIQFAAGAARGL